MREIKFRIWDKSMMRWWCEDSQYLQMDGKKIHPAPWSTLSAELPDDDIVIEQFTGLKDKNGKEIYEGDIIQMIYDSGRRGEIEEIEWLNGIDFDYAGWGTKTILTSQWKYSEVIGNIHEDPELLKINIKI